MIEAILHTPSPQWWLVGWIGSSAMLLVGMAIAALYYRGGETPPDVDPSPETSGGNA